MTYLFEPPTRIQTSTILGSLRYSFPVSSTVWKDTDGVWHAQETPPAETLAAASVRLAGTPQIVSDALAAELISAGVGTCTHIT